MALVRATYLTGATEMARVIVAGVGALLVRGTVVVEVPLVRIRIPGRGLRIGLAVCAVDDFEQLVSFPDIASRRDNSNSVFSRGGILPEYCLEGIVVDAFDIEQVNGFRDIRLIVQHRSVVGQVHEFTTIRQAADRNGDKTVPFDCQQHILFIV
jgi:hypothetical protein